MLSKEELKKIGIELTDEQLKALSEQIDNVDTIPKYRFDQVNERMKVAESDYNNLKAEFEKFKQEQSKTKDGEKPKSQANEFNLTEELEKFKNQLKAELSQVQLKKDVEIELAKSGARHREAISGFINFDNVKYDEKGKLIGLSEQLEALKKDESMSYLFKDSQVDGLQGVDVDKSNVGNQGQPEPETLYDALKMDYEKKNV